jgi:dienelactone hydrolase
MRRLVLAAVVSSLTLATPPAVASSTALHLPRPTGSQPVGSTSIYLKDNSRADPWVPANKRELMVTLWYPAKSGHGPKAQYLTPEESKLLLSREELPGIPLDVLSTVRTNSVRDAKPAGHNLPLIVLSPGYTKPRGTLTTLAEDLASHGYLVAGIEHTYESAGTSFPDGRVVSCVSCEVDHLPEFWQKLTEGRAADVSFVLDELTRKYDWLIDRHRIAMAGHSAGGAGSVHAMVKDARLRAAIDIDGGLHMPVPSGLAKPVMFVGSQAHGPGGPDTSWEDAWRNLAGWKRWLVVAGTQHASFTDVGLLGDQLGVDYGADLSGERTAEITRRYVRAFFEQHLQHRPQPLLDRPSTRYPEVKFCSVATKTCG